MTDMIHDTVTVPRRVAELAVTCIARAESQGAYDRCAMPTIGRVTMARLETALGRKEDK